VTAVPVDGAANQPGVDTNSDGEVMLDIEVAGAIAPAAEQHVYFAPNTDKGFLNAIKSAIHDGSVAPAAISISWGAPESQWTEQSRQSFEEAFREAAQLGITVCVASGDNGSSDGLSGLHVDFPASAPHSLACGGTKLEGSSSISREVAWNSGGGGTGGGVSDAFGLPSYQSGVHVPPPGSPKGGRGVPDVAGDADPASGYKVRVDGSDMVIGGTSAVAPLWAGLIARMNTLIGQPVGFIHPIIYKASRVVCVTSRSATTIPRAVAGSSRQVPVGMPVPGLDLPTVVSC
jgi:kumamolisin